jgi:hypothetical protein
MGARRTLNQGLNSLGRLTRWAANTGKGRVEALRNRATGPKPGMSDETITRKVETELFRDAAVPKGDISVNTVDGVVQLRGRVKRPEMVKSLEATARSIPEVKGVENLLHLPKTPARTSKPRRRTTQDAAQGRSSGRFNAEVKTAESEPTPAEVAARGAGRPSAPLGSDEDDSPPPTHIG